MMRDAMEELIGESAVMVRLRDLVRRLAPARMPVLIQGPTGSGKELVARALHLASGRGGRFVATNICAIPDTMFEDALFGHVRGAFSGADSNYPGLLLEADRGSVFLDEIGSLGLGAQGKLLRVVETRVFRPVGAHADRASDFRLLTATNLELRGVIESGRFRSDLAHRISGAVVCVPALSAHAEDVPALATHFATLAQWSRGRPPELAESAIAELSERDWPGNVRQLRNIVECAVALAADARVSGEDVRTALALGDRTDDSLTDNFARRRLVALLDARRWDTALVARDLEVHRGTVYRRMQALRIPTSPSSSRPHSSRSPTPIRANSHAFAANERESVGREIS
jgi:DNA-binding NtrC family response regulator